MTKKHEADVKGLTVTKAADMPAWYEQVCLKSEIVEFGVVKGTMVIRPRGYYIWQQIQDAFNQSINEPLGVANAYFPLFIPESFFKREAQHAEGFSPEVAWLDRELTKDGERLAIRPTSETIMYDSFSRWIRSYKDLPLKINQWCNVVRWETQATKLFLRSREFLWQEGHCVYETEAECNAEVKQLILLYQKLAHDVLALPMIVGKKTEKEKFAGAQYTYTIEGFMPDGKALQCGTTHNLGQGFSQVFGISYLGRDEQKHLPWQSSWGLSTRLIGAAVMTHSDDRGLVLPPGVAQNKLVIVPLFFKGSEAVVETVAAKLMKELKAFNPILDDRREHSPGYRFSEWELKGIPLRLEIGPKDIEKEHVTVVLRHNGAKHHVALSSVKKEVPKLLKTMHRDLYAQAAHTLKEQTVTVTSEEALLRAIRERKLALTAWCGETACEEILKEKTGGATSRCIPFDAPLPKGQCPYCDREASTMIYFSKSY